VGGSLSGANTARRYDARHLRWTNRKGPFVGFEAVEQQPSFPAIEERVLARWAERDIFARSLSQREGAPLFNFYEGPPTANGKPGTHHVEARAFKDVFPRYRTMKGYRVPRRAGWDCHGIPVEIEVEKELGFTRKSDIEAYGVAEFNARCRSSVQRYVDAFESLTERIAFWVDTDDAYWTMDDTYVESVWWSLKRLFDEGLLYEGHRVAPYCPRCGTALSDHEVAQGYAQADDPSVYVRLPLLDGPLAEEGASLLIWTTTPWTLISNTAVAVGDDIRYVLADGGEHGRVILAADLVEAVLGEGAEVLRDIAVDDLLGQRYEGPFAFVGPGSADGTPAHERWRTVVRADFVTTTDGTGIVHMAPAFGADDMAVGRANDLPVVNPVDREGRFVAAITPFAGQFVKDADADITAALRELGVLVKAGTYTHTYPFCWRCKSPLLYYAKPSWYIATTRIRERLLAENAEIDWHPDHIRDGRFGDWLSNNVDWALSRERYWGTPLPLWRCTDCEHVTAIGSRAELSELSGADHSGLDPHRPFVDEVTIPCSACGGTAQRVPEVIDVWYDSGSMPFAQLGYPHVEGSEAAFAEQYPADFIAEAIDQTRGWFYSLLGISTLLFDRASYKTVLCLGHIVDSDGRKMSKSVGNILDPWQVIEAHGADALRWLLLTDGSPWVARRVSLDVVGEVVRKFMLTLWNTTAFLTTYARLDGWTPDGNAPAIAERPVMDRWILAELHETVRRADEALERYDATAAGRALSAFVDDLSNWYVRRSRRRFWASSDDEGAAADKAAAFATLHTCLVEVAGLLAPFTPFLADELHERLVLAVDPDAPDSVHLRDFPVPDPLAGDAALRQAMAAARQVVELGRRARNDAKTGVRQPLRTALVTLPAEARDGWDLVADVVAEELNVKAIELPEGTDDVVSRTLKPNFRLLGPTFGSRTKEVAAAILDADADAVATALDSQGEATIAAGGESFTVTSAQVQVIEEARTGWQVASEGAYSVALDLALDDELRAEGLARELVRAVNDLRKRRDLDLADRIVLHVEAEGPLADAVEAHEAWIAGEVLAVEIRRGPAADAEELAVGEAVASIAVEVAG
jgi:isoleucyl-tRNA synthetase